MAKNSNQLMMRLEPQLAAELKSLSDASKKPIQELLRDLLWIGRKAMGRKVLIESKREKRRLVVETFAEYDKCSSLDFDNTTSK